MKSMNNDCNNGSSSNWLGVSLSPNMKTEANSSSPSPSLHHPFIHDRTEEEPSFYFPSSHHHHLNTTTTSSEVSCFDFHSPLSVMPLKSDGSLCIIDSTLSSSHSQGMVQSSSPKLEDFFQTHRRDTMVLSLDSSFYNQEPFRHPQQQQQQNPHPFYYTNPYHATNVEENLKLPPQISCEDEIPCLKAWMEHQHAFSDGVSSTVGCGDLQCLSLSMSPGSTQSSCVTASRQISPTETTVTAATHHNDASLCQHVVAAHVVESKKRGAEKIAPKQTVHRKSIDTFGQRTSQYRGVTRHRWTGRYEAHLWDNSCKKEGQTRKGRQVYLGGYDMEEKAARAYDLAALKYWGPSTHINFPLENYHQELEHMKNMTRQEYVAHLRRKSSGFSRGASMYRGVTRHHQHGRWQARIGRVAGNKDLYLGTFSTQEEAAEAYDIAAIKFRGVNAVTNFDISRYDVDKIMSSNALPTGDIARRTKQPDQPNPMAQNRAEAIGNASDWKMVVHDQAPQNQENVVSNVKTMSCYQNHPSLTVALHDLIGVDSGTDQMGQHFSNPSSLVTSLSSSREASPDRNGVVPMLLTKPSSWIPTAQLRPVPITTMPVFAAWNDA